MTVSLRQIEEAAGEHYGIDWRILHRRDRVRRTRPEIAHKRFVVWWLARELTRLSYQQIAYLMGGFDHTAVLWGVKQVQRAPDKFTADIEAVRHAVKRRELVR